MTGVGVVTGDSVHVWVTGDSFQLCIYELLIQNRRVKSGNGILVRIVVYIYSTAHLTKLSKVVSIHRQLPEVI